MRARKDVAPQAGEIGTDIIKLPGKIRRVVQEIEGQAGANGQLSGILESLERSSSSAADNASRTQGAANTLLG